MGFRVFRAIRVLGRRGLGCRVLGFRVFSAIRVLGSVGTLSN